MNKPINIGYCRAPFILRDGTKRLKFFHNVKRELFEDERLAALSVDQMDMLDELIKEDLESYIWKNVPLEAVDNLSRYKRKREIEEAYDGVKDIAQDDDEIQDEVVAATQTPAALEQVHAADADDQQASEHIEKRIKI